MAEPGTARRCMCPGVTSSLYASARHTVAVAGRCGPEFLPAWVIKAGLPEDSCAPDQSRCLYPRVCWLGGGGQDPRAHLSPESGGQDPRPQPQGGSPA